MKDKGYFYSGRESLFYIAHLSENTVNNKIGLIFVHASGGTRYGPHRMFVEMSDKLSDKYICIRFDLSGCGESSGDTQDDTGMHQEDIISAVTHFCDLYHLDQVYLLGMSRGAYLVYRILSENELPVAGAILLSCPVSSQKAAILTVSVRVRGYLRKLADMQSLKKLVTGKVNIKYIFKSFASALSLSRRYCVKNNSQEIQRSYSPMLFIYGQNDPICTESLEFYQEDCQLHNIVWQGYVVPYANHSFFHYLWKEEVYQIIRVWLDSNRDETVQKKKKYAIIPK